MSGYFAELFKDMPTWEETFAELDRRRGVPARTLKDDISNLDHEVFLELDEFAEWITINSVKLRAQMSWVSAERQKPDLAHKNGADFYIHPNLHMAEPYGELLTVVFRAKDYLREKERLPKNTEACYVNGDRFYVKSMQNEFGLVTLALEADRQGVPVKSAMRLPGLYE